MIPNWTPRDLDNPMIRDSLAHLASADVGALVSCPATAVPPPFVVALARRLGLDPTPSAAEWCVMFARPRD